MAMKIWMVMLKMIAITINGEPFTNVIGPNGKHQVDNYGSICLQSEKRDPRRRIYWIIDTKPRGDC